MPDAQWGFLDDDDDSKDIEDMSFDNFSSDFLDEDDDGGTSNHSMDDGLFASEDQDLDQQSTADQSYQSTADQSYMDTGKQYDKGFDQQYGQDQSYTQQDSFDVEGDDNGNDDDTVFGIVDPQDNLSTTRGQAGDFDDGMLDFSDSIVDDDGTPAEDPQDENTGPMYDGSPQYADQRSHGTDDQQSYNGAGQQSYGAAWDGSGQESVQDAQDLWSTDTQTQSVDPAQAPAPVDDAPQSAGAYQQSSTQPTTSMDGDQMSNLSSSPQGSAGRQNNWGQNTSGASTQSYQPLNGVMPKSTDVKTISKIINIIDDYRALNQEQQGYVEGFLTVVRQMNRSDVDIDGTEASVVKSMIEIDPNIREGVVELDKLKRMDGSERAFYMMGLNANQLQNVDLILKMLQVKNDQLHVTNDLASIRTASMQLDKILNTAFGVQQQNFIKPILEILLDVQKVMED